MTSLQYEEPRSLKQARRFLRSASVDTRNDHITLSRITSNLSTSELSAIKPNNIPIPLGLPIVYNNPTSNLLPKKCKHKSGLFSRTRKSITDIAKEAEDDCSKVCLNHQIPMRDLQQFSSVCLKDCNLDEEDDVPETDPKDFDDRTGEDDWDNHDCDSECIATEAHKLPAALSETRLQTLFSIIQFGHIKDLDQFLNMNKYCFEVEITPKFGCNRKYYSENINPVNTRDMFGNCPLLLTCKMGSIRNDMTMRLLKYGANPNQIDSNNDCPLVYVAQSVSLSPSHENKTLLKELLLHGADINTAVDVLCCTLLTPDKESCTAIMSLSVLIHWDNLILAKDPIKTAHLCNEKLFKVSQLKKEYTMDCKMLAKEANDFSFSFLDSCRTLWEARRLLCGSNYIDNAIRTREKRFLAHPFCQEIILEDFFGSKDSKNICTQMHFIVTFLTGIVLVPFYVLVLVINSLSSGDWRYRYSRLNCLMQELLTPCYSLFADVFNYTILLGILITVALTTRLDKDIDCSDGQKDNLTQYFTIAPLEIILWLCILSRLMTELYQAFLKGAKSYFSNFWNCVDVTICSLLTAAFGIRLWSCTSQFDPAIKHGEDCPDIVETFKMYTMTAVYIYSKLEKKTNTI